MQKIDLTYIVTMKLVSDANKNKYTFKLLHHPSVIIYPIEIALAHIPMCTPIQRAGSKMFAKLLYWNSNDAPKSVLRFEIQWTIFHNSKQKIKPSYSSSNVKNSFNWSYLNVL